MPSLPLSSRRPLVPRAARAAAFAAALLAALGGAPGPAAADVHPTDSCVARKLEAAGLACRRLLDVRAYDQIVASTGGLAPQFSRIEAELAAAWSAAEAASDAAGVSCVDTTVTAAEMSDLLGDGAAELATLAQADTGSGLRGRHERYLRLRGAGIGCQIALRGEGRHVVERSRDRERARLATEREVGFNVLRVLATQTGGGATAVQDLVDGLTKLVRDAFLASVVSPAVPQAWMQIDPTPVSYRGQTLAPICSGGTPYTFFARRGTVNKLVVYYQGGGACWDYLTCAVARPYKQTTGPGDNPANFQSGFNNDANPENPFRDWHSVFIPYCTGDVHWGSETVKHDFVQGNSITIEHKGFVNAQVAEKWAREHFVNPDQVFVTGSSAGAYGAVMGGAYFKEGVYPSTEFVVVGDAGNGVITQDFLENEIQKWGVEKILPTWIPGLNKPLTDLSAADLWAEAALFYSKDRWANYTTAFDGGNGGQTGFYQIMLNPGNLGVWTSWWQASCAWNAGMRAQSQTSAARASNYRYYIGSGSRHTMWGNNKVYSDTTGGVPRIVDWLNAMLANTPAWTNVECTDCGALLAGDPRPGGNPMPAPFTSGKVSCPGTP